MVILISSLIFIFVLFLFLNYNKKTNKVGCPQIKITNNNCPAANNCPNCNTVFFKKYLMVKNSILVNNSKVLPSSKWTYDFYTKTIKNVLSGSYLLIKNGISVTLDSSLATKFYLNSSNKNPFTTCISWNGTNIIDIQNCVFYTQI